MDITIPYYEDNSRISNSSLGWFLQSPSYFRKKLDGEVDESGTVFMEFGTMVHSYLLEPEEFKKLYKIKDVDIPTSAQQKKFSEDYIKNTEKTVKLKAIKAYEANYSTKGKSEEKIASEALKLAMSVKAYIQYLRSSASKDGKKFVSWTQYNNLRAMKENVLMHKAANELLYKSSEQPTVEANNEFHINWEYPNKAKSRCKSLIDRVTFDHTNKKITLIDVKTTKSASKFKESFDLYDYGRQMAFYWLAIYWYCKNILQIDTNTLDEYTTDTRIVAVQTSGSFECRVFSINNKVIDNKTTEIQSIISEIDWHESNNKWDYRKEYYEGDGSESLK